MVKSALFILTAILFLFTNMKSANADPIKLTATLNAIPPAYSGTCPAKIAFRGKITLTVDPAVKIAWPVKVNYKFKRSDGATDTLVKTLTFNQPGSQDVSTTWQLGGPGLLTYSGWKTIDILMPQHVESNKANFESKCNDFKVERVFISTKDNPGVPAPLPLSKGGNYALNCEISYIGGNAAPCTSGSRTNLAYKIGGAIILDLNSGCIASNEKKIFSSGPHMTPSMNAQAFSSGGHTYECVITPKTTDNDPNNNSKSMTYQIPYADFYKHPSTTTKMKQ